MMLKLLSGLLFAILLSHVYALKCHKYEFRGYSCNLFRHSSLTKRFVEECSLKATGCRHFRGVVSSNWLNDINTTPPILESRGCFVRTEVTRDGCTFGTGWTEALSDGKELIEVDILGVECSCFTDLCNGKDLPRYSYATLREKLIISFIVLDILILL